jgi:putative restriction endonuclease
MFDRNYDAQVRTAAFKWLEEQVAIHGDVLPREILIKGFIFGDERVPLMGPQGIFKPKVLADVPLSITTSPKGPYDDSFDRNGMLRYRYRGTDPQHVENRGLRTAMQERIPLIYFHGIAPGKYMATWPVFVVDDNQADLSFLIEVDDQRRLGMRPEEQRYAICIMGPLIASS